MDTSSELIAHSFSGLRRTTPNSRPSASPTERRRASRARAAGKVIGRPDWYGRWHETLAAMREDGYGMKRMSRETQLSDNTVKKYLDRMDTELPAASSREG